jgi:hypothetical protein
VSADVPLPTTEPSLNRRFYAPAAALLVFRLLMLAALPYDVLFGYGDYQHFFNLAEFARLGPGGLPFLDHWVEFPPLFPYLSLGIHALSGGTLHLYGYALAFLMTLCDVANVILLIRIARKSLAPPAEERLGWVYAGFLALPAFGWWTFEPLVVLWLLLALDALLSERPTRAGLAIGLGVLTKLIPGIVLAAAWRFWPPKRWARTTAAAAIIVAAGILPFLALRPEMTLASLRSQAAKGSWETVWALLDGNPGTGIFGPLSERLDPAEATMPRGQPARIPHWIPSLIAGAIALWAFLRAQGDRRKALPLLAFLLALLFLWSRGWSPQWLAYLVPLLLLSVSLRQSLVFGLNLVAISLLEWPVLLTRGRFDLLWIPVILRTSVILLLAVVFFQRLGQARTASDVKGAP